MPLHDISLVLAPDAKAPSIARSSLGKLESRVGEERLEQLRLLVTEVVTNSVLHASLGPKEEIRFEVRVSGGVIRCEVTDPGPGFEKPSFDGKGPLSSGESSGESGASGWGLFMVDKISSRWEVERGDRTRVWFEVEDRSPDA